MNRRNFVQGLALIGAALPFTAKVARVDLIEITADEKLGRSIPYLNGVRCDDVVSVVVPREVFEKEVEGEAILHVKSHSRAFIHGAQRPLQSDEFIHNEMISRKFTGRIRLEFMGTPEELKALLSVKESIK